MTTRLTELCILFLSVVKWFIFASVVGLLVGVSSTLFLIGLQGSIALTQSFPYAILLLPVGLAISAVITTKLAPEAQGHGTERVIRAIHQQGGKIQARVIPTKFVATIVTIASGGSAGNIGPCAQIGGGLCSLLGQLVRLEDIDRTRLVLCGISAGFAAVFGTPVAGALFAVEVLFIGRLSYSALFPSLVAAFVGYHVASALGITYLPLFVLPVPSFDLALFLSVVVAGAVFGLAAFAFVELLLVGKRLASLTKTSGVLTGLVGGTSLMVVALFFSDAYLGLGWTQIAQVLNGETLPWYAFALKAITTSVTLNFGGSGGIILPICFYGATLGSALAQGLGLDPATFAALGLVSVLAGATNTPIAGIVLAMELFGPSMAPYAAISCAMSYLLTGHRSAIPTQLLHEAKSPSLTIATQQEIEGASWAIILRRNTLTKLFFSKQSSSHSSDQ